MDDVTVHENFIAQHCAAVAAPQAAVTLGAGALWIDAYHKVTTQGGRYVQGGGCTTVGVAGLIQSGGFGNFSKQYGTAAANLLEAEVVTADGIVRLVNACTHPDLFWAIKGGGGGSFGVITRVTLRVHALPETFGAVFGTITASSESAYQQLIAKFMQFYHSALFNSHWGEQVAFNTDNTLELSLVFQGMTQVQVEELWQPFLVWIAAEKTLSFSKPFQCLAIPAQHFWDADYLNKVAPGVMVADSRSGAPKHHTVWEGDKGQAGWFIHGYQSAWLPDMLLSQERQSDLTTAIYHSSRHWRVALHFNKGLAGAPATALAAARDTAMNPDVLSAFALAIIAGGSSAAFTGMPNTAPDLEEARANAKRIKLAMDALTQVVPHAGSYVSESDYFNPNWQLAFWGSNYPRLVVVKKNYDPDELFMVHHGVGG
jgi:FAD/FMN-containing dehydrogenase